MSDTEDIHQLASRIRELGGVVAVFTPEEVERVPEEDTSRIEDAMVEAANHAIELLQVETHAFDPDPTGFHGPDRCRRDGLPAENARHQG